MSSGTKITEIIKQKDVFYSFEVTPDIKLEEIDKLKVNPSFFSITWHSKLYQSKDLDIPPLVLAKTLKNKGKEVLLHLSCDLLRKEYLDSLLNMLRENGIRNLFVVRGEGYEKGASDFETTTELIKYIREKTADYFCIGVVGFATDSEQKMLHLKEKVDAGADFIITQAMFTLDDYKKIVNNCKEANINIPIIPGVFVFDTYDQLTSFVKLCRIKLSQDVLDDIKDKNEAEVSAIIKKFFEDIRNEGITPLNFHVFTMNKLERAAKLMKDLIK